MANRCSNAESLQIHLLLSIPQTFWMYFSDITLLDVPAAAFIYSPVHLWPAWELKRTETPAVDLQPENGVFGTNGCADGQTNPQNNLSVSPDTEMI